MAEEALKKLKEQLHCSICHNTYSDPKVLQCSHVYCQQCLESLVVQDKQGQPGLTCPTCRQVTPVPDNGVPGLQSATYIKHLLNIQASFQKIQTSATPVASKASSQSCSEHAGEKLKLYCETCSELICWKCAIKDGKHHSHDYKELSKAFQNCKREISSSLVPLEDQIAAIEKALEQLDSSRELISEQQAAIKGKIHITFKRLQEILGARETDLIGQLDQTTQGKLKSLAAQRDQIETTLAQLSNCLLFLKEGIKTGKKDVLVMKTDTPKKVKELIAAFDHDSLKPITQADIVLSASADMTAGCRNYAQVLAPGLPDPSKCHTTGQGLEKVMVEEKSTAVLQAIDVECKPCEKPISLECELVSEIAGTRASCSIKRREQNQYEISYQPTIKGRHQLHIKPGGQHVRGSPFSVAVKSPIEKLGIPVLTIGCAGGPLGVAINQAGEVVVTECDGNCVSAFSPSGEKFLSFGTLGSDQGQFQDPHGVTIDGEGNILVADKSNHRIQKFTADGQFLAAVGTKGSGPLQFCYPVDIAFNASNNKLYVSDEGNHQVQILNSDLTFSDIFGKKGSGKGRFNLPWGVACDSAGKVYVADSCNHRIQVFTAEGKFLMTFGKRGQGKGELDLPVGVAIDADGMVYVSERNNFRVSMFTSEGEMVTSFGKRGKGPGDFHWPSGLTVDDSGVVYVCDSVSNIVKVF